MKTRGFTLLELLIVIGILAVLATVTFMVLNPAELLKQARDARRIQDLSSTNGAINLILVSNPDFNFGSSTFVYVSLPDTSPNCANLSLPSLPSGWSYKCVTQANLRKVDGQGWIPIKFSSSTFGSPLSVLPVDPLNTAVNNLYYTYVTGGSWELTALLESEEKHSVAINDRGMSPGVFEIGTSIGLTPATRDMGLVGYWSFNEGLGTTAQDYSGQNNTGTLINGQFWQSLANCKSGTCLKFDGWEYVDIGNGASLNITDKFTIAGWVRTTQPNDDQGIIDKSSWGPSAGRGWWLRAPAGIINFGIGTGANEQTIGTYQLVSWTWTYITATKDSSGMKLYINGNLNDQNSFSSILSASGNPNSHIGHTEMNNFFWIGRVDEVRIYNRALNADEIKALYNATN